MIQKKDSKISGISLNVDSLLNMQQNLKYGGHVREAEAQRKGYGSRVETMAAKHQSSK